MKLLTTLKLFSFLGSSTLVTGSTVVPLIKITTENPSSLLDSDTQEFNWFMNMVKNNSKIIGDQKHYSYDNHDFNSEGELEDYLFTHNKIKSYLTSSDPNKIIKDSEHETLDESKIFDKDLDNFEQVFETASQKPTLDYNEALSSFINPANVVKEYSYDSVNWFSNKIDATNDMYDSLQVKPSLYYFLNGRYYNAFNKKDINDFINLNMKDGYYFDYNHNFENEKIPNKIFYGTPSLISKSVKAYLEDNFSKGYYKNFYNSNINNGLKIKVGNEAHITLDGKTYNAGDTLYLKLDSTYKYDNYNDLLNNFKSGWEWVTTHSENRHYGPANGGLNVWYTAGYYAKTFSIIDYNGFSKKQTMQLFHDDRIVKGYYQNPIPGSYPIAIPVSYPMGVRFNINSDAFYEDNTMGVFDYFFDKNKTVKIGNTETKMGRYTNFLDNDQLSTFSKLWTQKYLNDVMFNFAINDIFEWPSNNIKDFNYLKNNNDNFWLGDLYKDKIYSFDNTNSSNGSVINSLLKWQVKKQEIIDKAEGNSPNNNLDENSKIYQINPALNFKVKKAELDDYFYLDGPGVSPILLYSAKVDEQYPSDPTGKWLYKSALEAKNVRRIYESKSLKIRYNLYDLDGKYYSPIYTDNIYEALDKIKSKYKLNSRFVNKDEFENFQKNYGREPYWNDLVANGKYTVYRIDSPYDNSGIWYKSESRAIDEIKQTLLSSTKLKEFTEHFLVYNYTNDNGEMIPLKYRESELELVTKKLLELKGYL